MKSKNYSKSDKFIAHMKNLPTSQKSPTKTITSKYLFIDITYHLGNGKKDDSFKIKSNLTKAGQNEILESFLRSEMGTGADHRPPAMKKEYHISLKYSPEYDSDVRFLGDKLSVYYDTKNKGLRDGIIMKVLGSLV